MASLVRNQSIFATFVLKNLLFWQRRRDTDLLQLLLGLYIFLFELGAFTFQFIHLMLNLCSVFFPLSFETLLLLHICLFAAKPRQSKSITPMHTSSNMSFWSKVRINIVTCSVLFRLRFLPLDAIAKHGRKRYDNCFVHPSISSDKQIYTVCVKKVAPLKLFAIFSLRLSIFPWNFANLLPVYIHTCLPFLVDLT